MKVRITKPCRVSLLSGEVEVSEQEYNRLALLGLIEERETPEVEKKQTRKTKK